MKNSSTWMFIISVIILFSCSPKTTVPLAQERLKNLKNEELIEALVELQNSYPSHIYSKIDAKFHNSTMNYSFKISLKIAQDSAINALVTYLKIPILTANIDKDTIKLVNRRDKCYTIKDLELIKSNFGVDFDYKNIEEILMGRPIDFDPNGDLYILQDNRYYVVSTHNKKAIRNEVDDNNLIINYYINKDLKSLAKVELFTADKSTYVTIDFLEHQEVDNFLLPKNIKIFIKAPKEKTNIALIYEKIEVNSPRDMSVVIPDNYVVCP